MSIEPDQIRARIEELLAELPGDTERVELAVASDDDELTRRLEEAHSYLVHALESVEKG